MAQSRSAPEEELSAYGPAPAFVAGITCDPVKRRGGDLGEQPLGADALLVAVFLHDAVADLAAGHAIEGLLDGIDPGDVPDVVLRVVHAQGGAVHAILVGAGTARQRRGEPNVLNSAPAEHPAEVHLAGGLAAR